VRLLGKRWKQVEKVASEALDESYPYLGELRDRAINVKHNARFLSKFFISPIRKRPLESEIAECKQAIVSFLRTRGVREVNTHGWILLRTVFQNKWKAASGKDQIEAFRAIPEPFRGRITSRKKAQTVMEKTKLIVFEMTNKQTAERQ
jgi:hypothetical protein